MVGKNFNACINFFNLVLSYHVMLREIHFNTTSQAQHDLTNDIMPAIMDYADLVMENAMGMFGRPGYDILKVSSIKCVDLTKCLENLRSETLSFKLTLTKDTFAGINKVLDDLLSDLNKWIYLSENK